MFRFRINQRIIDLAILCKCTIEIWRACRKTDTAKCCKKQEDVESHYREDRFKPYLRAVIRRECNWHRIWTWLRHIHILASSSIQFFKHISWHFIHFSGYVYKSVSPNYSLSNFSCYNVFLVSKIRPYSFKISRYVSIFNG